MNKIDIARTCHNANKALCEAHGDYSQLDYDSAPKWQKKSILDGVEFHLANDCDPEESHEHWMKHKENDGWAYGPVKDSRKKTHPCMVSYDKLPPIEKAKDKLITAIVRSLKAQLTTEGV